jgi:hypothetical protein
MTARVVFFLAALCGAIATSACSHRAAAGPVAPARQFKPGSHAARVVARLQHLRVVAPEHFKRLVRAKAVSPVFLRTFAGSGPYRRVLARPGYSYVSGTVFLPCDVARLRPSFETAFAYVGGWGAGRDGTAVDAGFQRSNEFDDYATFLRAQGYRQLSGGVRFRCNHAVAFAFYAATDTELRFQARGYTERGRDESVAIRLRHDARFGWPRNGGGTTDGIVLKRMTTIAQSDAVAALPYGSTWDTDGSFFGHYAGDVRPRIHWSRMTLARIAPDGRPAGITPWGAAQTEEAGGEVFDYPDITSDILSTCTGCPDEKDAIDLRSKTGGR